MSPFAIALGLLLASPPGRPTPRYFRSDGRPERAAADVKRVSVPLTADDCTGAAQSLSDGTAISWTRATTATCTKNDGTLTTVSSGQPRCNSSGCLIEPAATNTCQQSADFSTGLTIKFRVTVTTDNTTAPDGTTSADLLTDNATAGTHGGFAGNCVQSNGNFTASVYAKMNTARYLALSTSGDISYAIFDLQGITATTGGNATAATITAAANGFYRLTVTWNGTVGNGVNVYLGTSNATIISGYSGSGSSLWVWGLQLEAGTVTTSYIATAAASATRNADNVSFNKPTWLSDKQGCASATLTLPSGFAATGTAARVLSAGGSTNTLLHISSSYNAVGITDGTNSAFFSVTLLGNSTTARSSWGPGGLSITDGVSSNSTSYDGSIFEGSTLYIGSTGATNFLRGYISNIRLGSTPGGCQ